MSVCFIVRLLFLVSADALYHCPCFCICLHMMLLTYCPWCDCCLLSLCGLVLVYVVFDCLVVCVVHMFLLVLAVVFVCACASVLGCFDVLLLLLLLLLIPKQCELRVLGLWLSMDWAQFVVVEVGKVAVSFQCVEFPFDGMVVGGGGCAWYVFCVCLPSVGALLLPLVGHWLG